MEKKLRIQLFDDEGRLIDDRQVSQGPELAKGPIADHKGLFRIEFTFDCKDDIEKAKTYLDQMVGNLPIGSKKIRKQMVEKLDDPDERAKVLEYVISTAVDQDALITMLREKGFVFMMTDFLDIFDFDNLEIKDRHKEEYQWMIRNIRIAKNPKADRYDPMLIFGIRLLPEHDEKIVVYLNGAYHKSFKVPIPTKPKEVFKKTMMIKFPHYMNEEEREKFRYELRLYQNQPDREYSKFYNRWKSAVENLPILPQDKKDTGSE